MYILCVGPRLNTLLRVTRCCDLSVLPMSVAGFKTRKSLGGEWGEWAGGVSSMTIQILFLLLLVAFFLTLQSS